LYSFDRAFNEKMLYEDLKVMQIWRNVCTWFSRSVWGCNFQGPIVNGKTTVKCLFTWNYNTQHFWDLHHIKIASATIDLPTVKYWVDKWCWEEDGRRRNGL